MPKVKTYKLDTYPIGLGVKSIQSGYEVKIHDYTFICITPLPPQDDLIFRILMKDNVPLYFNSLNNLLFFDESISKTKEYEVVGKLELITEFDDISKYDHDIGFGEFYEVKHLFFKSILP